MKQFLCAAVFIFMMQAAFSQTTDSIPLNDTALKSSDIPPVASAKKSRKRIDLNNRSNDHLMLQYGVDSWMGTNDTINPKGFSRFFNFYLMLDKPFRNNPKFSVGLGLGIGSDNIFFKNTYVDVKATGSKLPFSNVDSIEHFKKFKLTTIFLEAPIELRFSSDPEHNGRSFKIALGAKVGTLLKAYTKGKTLQDKNGNSLNNYIEKQYDKRFFNSTRLSATARIGYGLLSLYGSYQLTSLLKDGAGPSEIKPYSIGICLSGL